MPAIGLSQSRSTFQESYILNEVVKYQYLLGCHLIRMRYRGIEAKVKTLGVSKGAVLATMYGRK